MGDPYFACLLGSDHLFLSLDPGTNVGNKGHKKGLTTCLYVTHPPQYQTLGRLYVCP